MKEALSRESFDGCRVYTRHLSVPHQLIKLSDTRPTDRPLVVYGVNAVLHDWIKGTTKIRKGERSER